MTALSPLSRSMYVRQTGMTNVEVIAAGGSAPSGADAATGSQTADKTAPASARQGDTAEFSDAAKQLAAGATGYGGTGSASTHASSVSQYGTVSADQDVLYLKPGETAIIEQPLVPGSTELLGTATTKSGRRVSVSQFVTAPEKEGQAARVGYMVNIGGDANHEAQSFQVTGDSIINEDENGELRISAYSAGKETDGDDIIIGSGGGTLSGGKGDDTIFDVSPNMSKTISGGDGNDTIIVAANSVNDTIDAGAGDDKLIVKAGILGGEIKMGDGNDTIQARNIGTTSGQTTIDTGDGNDAIDAEMMIGGGSSVVNITTGDGNDKIHSANIGMGNDQVNIDTGDGNDVVDASWIGIGAPGAASQVNIKTGKGNDTVSSSWIGAAGTNGSTQVNIDTGEGNDKVHSSWIGAAAGAGASSQVNISTGDGNDVISSSSIGASFFHGKSQVNIDTGKGDDRIDASYIGFSLDDNAEDKGMLSVVRSASGDTFVGGTSGDDLIDARSGRLYVGTAGKTDNGE